MKVYGLFPAIDFKGADAEALAKRCVSIVVEMVFDSLRDGGDTFHYLVDWRDPGAAPGTGMFNGDIAEPHVMELRQPDALREWLHKAVDPNDPEGGVLRSIATCRAATFGYDGQAFLCLRHEDAPPASPDPTLVVVEERPDILVDYDLFDGWIRDDSTSGA